MDYIVENFGTIVTYALFGVMIAAQCARILITPVIDVDARTYDADIIHKRITTRAKHLHMLRAIMIVAAIIGVTNGVWHYAFGIIGEVRTALLIQNGMAAFMILFCALGLTLDLRRLHVELVR